jgi:NADPH:quinone reductase-like Zn-dependent oxidoreductase
LVHIAQGNPIRMLFGEGYALQTTLLWIIFFCSLLDLCSAVRFCHDETRLIGAGSRKRDAVASVRLLANITDGLQRGHYTAPIVNARYPLACAKNAYAAVERGSQGRIVLTP